VRQNLKDIVQLLSELVHVPEPIVELGAFQVETQVGFADLRPFFPGKRYIGCDMRLGPGVDRLENVHRLSFGDDSVGSLLCLDTLEHVANCHLAVDEMLRVLAPGGLIMLASVMDFEIHDFPSDYWRFTPKGVEMLMRRFQPLHVCYQGDALKPHTVMGLGRKAGGSFPLALRERLSALQPEPVVEVELGLGEDAFAEEMRNTSLTDELDRTRRELASTRSDLDAIRDSTTWKLAVKLRDLPFLRGPLRQAVRAVRRALTSKNRSTVSPHHSEG
jgi:SAM-dependent methyltransferase